MNSSENIETTVDKSLTSIKLSQANLFTPKTWVFRDIKESKKQAQTLLEKHNLIYKPLFGSQGDNVTKVSKLNDFDKINNDSLIHGVIVQLPLPDHISVAKVLNRIHPSKDVDGFTPNNVGKLFLGEDTLVSCTPKGIMQMLRISGTDLSGKNVTVIGRSNIVGKPVSILCQSENATVTMCHSRTKDLNHKLSDADVIIVAVGVPKFISGDQIPEGAVVIDVGIHNIDGKLCGDVDFESAKEKASAITPVPGGVGPMTVCALIENTIIAAERINSA